MARNLAWKLNAAYLDMPISLPLATSASYLGNSASLQVVPHNWVHPQQSGSQPLKVTELQLSIHGVAITSALSPVSSQTESFSFFSVRSPVTLEPASHLAITISIVRYKKLLEPPLFELKGCVSSNLQNPSCSIYYFNYLFPPVCLCCDETSITHGPHTTITCGVRCIISKWHIFFFSLCIILIKIILKNEKIWSVLHECSIIMQLIYDQVS